MNYLYLLTLVLYTSTVTMNMHAAMPTGKRSKAITLCEIIFQMPDALTLQKIFDDSELTDFSHKSKIVSALAGKKLSISNIVMVRNAAVKAYYQSLGKPSVGYYFMVDTVLGNILASKPEAQQAYKAFEFMS